jgi:hypothetical protein
MEEQRKRVRSTNLTERFAAALLIPGVLAERLRELNDVHLGQLLEHEVCSNLSVVAPELTVCMEAAERLCRRRAGKFIAVGRSRASLQTEGEHLLHAESALYHAGIPHLLPAVSEQQVREQHLHGALRARSEDLLMPSGISRDSALCHIAR